jgi:hypothetical protein
MSGKYLARALHYGGPVTPEERLVLVVLGDNADEDGFCQRAPYDFMARMLDKPAAALQELITGMEQRDLVNRCGRESIEVLISDADPFL